MPRSVAERAEGRGEHQYETQDLHLSPEWNVFGKEGGRERGKEGEEREGEKEGRDEEKEGGEPQGEDGGEKVEKEEGMKQRRERGRKVRMGESSW